MGMLFGKYYFSDAILQYRVKGKGKQRDHGKCLVCDRQRLVFYSQTSFSLFCTHLLLRSIFPVHLFSRMIKDFLWLSSIIILNKWKDYHPLFKCYSTKGKSESEQARLSVGATHEP